MPDTANIAATTSNASVSVAGVEQEVAEILDDLHDIMRENSQSAELIPRSVLG